MKDLLVLKLYVCNLTNPYLLLVHFLLVKTAKFVTLYGCEAYKL